MRNIVLLHGALGIAEDLDNLSEVLAKTGFNTHRFSFPGHGPAPYDGKFDIGTFSIALKDYITTNKLNGCEVFGYSMGGYVALYLASTSPGFIGRIVTLGTKFNWNESSVEKEIKMLDPESIKQKVPAFASQLAHKHGHDWPSLLLRTAELMRDISARQYLDKQTLKNIRIPVSVGIADKDQMVSLEETTGVFETLPDASLFVLPGSKHQLETVNNNLLAQTISGLSRQV